MSQQSHAVEAPTYDAWMDLAAEEYRRLHAVLRDLSAEEWRLPTACTGWDVHAMVSHLVGAAEATASLREAARQAVRGRHLAPDGMMVDRMNALQVHERRGCAPEQLVADLADAGARGVRARRAVPGPLRALPVPFGPPLGVRPVGYLTGRIYTRDAWMHRLDLAEAIGRPALLTAEHDGRIVDDVVREWAREHHDDYDLTLTGPAGGHWHRGAGGEPLTLDAVDMCRVLSGRGVAEGLLAHAVQF